MPRNKKNKGGSGPTPAPNNNKAKSPVETKVVESPAVSVPVLEPQEAETSNDDLKLRLANAKERLHILQEVIGGIGDPTDVENLKASGIDAAKEKLNIIQDSVDSVKTTLLQVRQETARSVTPEGSQSGTNKKRKNKKHQNQNPPQGFVAREPPSADENTSKATSDREELDKEEGTSTLSKKKRNRNRNKNKAQQGKLLASELIPQESSIVDKSEATNIAVEESEEKAAPVQAKSQTKETTPTAQPKSPLAQPEAKESIPQQLPKQESKENSAEINKSKYNKKNNKKGQQNTNSEKAESDCIVDAEVQSTDLIKTPIPEIKTSDSNKPSTVEPVSQTPANNKNKNKKNKNRNAEANINLADKVTELTEDRDNKSKIHGESNVTENTATDDAQAKPSNLKKEEPQSQKENSQSLNENQKKSQDTKVTVKDQPLKDDQKKENSAVNIGKVQAKDIPKTTESKANNKSIAESPKLDPPKNKKDKKKGQAEIKQPANKVEEKQSEVKGTASSNAESLAKDEAKISSSEPVIAQATKSEMNLDMTSAVKSIENVSENIVASTTPVKEKQDSDTSHQQSPKNKKNKQQVLKTEQKPIELLPSDNISKPVADKISTEKSTAPVSKETNVLLNQAALTQKEEFNKTKDDDILKTLEKDPVLQVTASAAVPTDTKTLLNKKIELMKNDGLAKPVVDDTTALDSTPALPKLDFSQVVKDNKEKIPLMEIKVSPILAPDANIETKPTDSAIKSEAKTDNPITDAVKEIGEEKILAADIKSEFITKAVPTVIKPTAEETSKLALDVKSAPIPIADVSIADTMEPKGNTSSSTEYKVGSNAKQNKAKTPERKGNQANLKNDQKKPQQGKGQNVKPTQSDPKPQSNKKEETKVIPEKVIPAEATTAKELLEKNFTTEKVEAKLDTPAATLQIKEKKIENVTKKDQDVKKEQVTHKPDEKTLETKSASSNLLTDKEAHQKKVGSTEKQQPISQDRADKNVNKKSVSPVASAEPQKKDNKPEISQSQAQKQEQKIELSKKDQKKQNKMKGKAPLPPDIPMDMSILSASMIDPATDEAISHEESEDQSSLIASDSKNVAGSGFVQSVDSLKATADATKSLEPIQTIPKTENKITEIEREAKSSSPSSSKRNKDMANFKESVEMQKTKIKELPEKSAQQKMEPVQLMDILEAKMTSPAVKPGNIAGNVRKLPKDTKRTEQLNVQQQKSRSKSPKENLAEKYVKNQQLASGDTKKQATQNIKNEILKTEVGALVTSISKEKEVKESTKSDANITEPKLTPATASITTAATIAEQVANLEESDAISKQKAEPMPKNTTTPDPQLNQSSNDGKTGVAVGGKNETKPKIAPKPNVPSKTAAPKVADRSKKSPVKTPGKESPTKDTTTPSKAPTQAKATTQSKTPAAKPPPQTKSQPQAKAVSPTTAVTPSKSPSTQLAKKPETPPKPNLPKASPNKTPQTPIQDEEEEFVEYKFTPRPVFIATACQICKVPLDILNPCKHCQMVSYCSDEHEKEDQALHAPFCAAIQEIAKKRGGHIYNNCRILNDDDYRSLRVHTLNLCENFLKRHLMPFEREMLLFPRLCCKSSCREWRQQSLIECKQCGQVSYCAAHPEHLPQQHEQWCNSFNLYQKIVLRQKNFGRIEPGLPSKIMLKPFDLSDNVDNVFKILYKNYGAIKDECIYATLTQLATAPLTALYGAQKNQQQIGEVYTIHLVGAELQFEADTLDKWETFFLHLVPTLVECRVVFVGPELNAENLPLEILSRIRMCRTCRQNCRIVKFDFQCGMLYHDYVNSSAFTKPDLICFFNPGLYRSTGFNGLDTWPNTIKSASSMNCPIVVTSYTEFESPRDLERIQKESGRPLTVVQSPQINPFASQRPERNFISDEVAPMIFKNFFCFFVK